MAELLSTLSIISFVIGAVCFVASIFLWVFLKIPTVIGDLTGRTARKSIAKMRAANEKSGKKGYQRSKTNLERGKVTQSIPQPQVPSQGTPTTADDGPKTGILIDNRAPGADPEETVTLMPETTGLLVEEEATAPLVTPVESREKPMGGGKLTMLEDIMLIHTDEVIG